MIQFSQEVGGKDNGLYQIQLAMLEFDDIPSDADHNSSATATSSGTPAATSTNSNAHPDYPVSSILSIVEHGTAARTFSLEILLVYGIYTMLFSLYIMRGWVEG